MAVIRIPGHIHAEVHKHLFGSRGEHFAFLRARITISDGEPVFLVHGAKLVADEHVSAGRNGWEIDPDVLLEIVNGAIRRGDALVEAHNHGGGTPRPSGLDREQYADFVPYILASLADRPYAATVWAGSSVYGEFFLADGTTRAVRSITAVGDSLRQLVSRDDASVTDDTRYDRQLPWFTDAGQKQLGRLRIAIVGAGGTGSHLALQLSYLGARDFIVIDKDVIDDTSGNRTVTATPADLGTPKAIAARRTIKSVAPDATVNALAADVRDPTALHVLKGTDVLVGCVDNDGARLILNEIAVGYGIPYADLAVGIDATEGILEQAGGRLAVVLPGGPCLLCMGEINRIEARYFLSTLEQQAEQVRRGYIVGMDVPAPSVVSLNGTIASLAINELALYLTGARPIQPLTYLDLLGTARPLHGQWVTPMRVEANLACVTCAHSGYGDDIGLERYELIG